MTASDLNEDHGSSLRDTQPVAETPVVSGHTPGPWVAMPDYKHGPVVKAPDGSFIADFTVWSDFPEEAKANARLIAAAPDLLASNIELRNRLMAFVGALAEMTDCGPDVDAIVRADAAIAKATNSPPSRATGEA